MRNYKQTDVEKEKEGRIKKRDIFAVAAALAGAFIFIVGVI